MCVHTRGGGGGGLIALKMTWTNTEAIQVEVEGQDDSGINTVGKLNGRSPPHHQSSISFH